MREILFRGKRVDTKEWIEGSLITLDSTLVGNHRYIVDKSIKTNLRRVSTKYNEHDWRTFGVEPSTVGQFTGLTDKNGRRIFEGDIVEFINIDRQYVKGIVYYFGSCFLIQSIVVDEDNYNLGGAFSLAKGLIKVIGNIHEGEKK